MADIGYMFWTILFCPATSDRDGGAGEGEMIPLISIGKNLSIH